MPNFNKVIMIGHITRDIETIDAGGTTIAKFGIAVNEQYKSKTGETVKNTCFIDCDAFGKTGETIERYFQKGDPILIEGSIQLDQWNDAQGNKRAKHKIKVSGFSFVASADKSSGQQGGKMDNYNDDDLPF